MKPARPTVAISLGDPAGIGAEVTVKALSDPTVRAAARWAIHGSNHSMHEAAERSGLMVDWFRVSADSDRAQHEINAECVVLDHGQVMGLFDRREPSKIGGLASKAYVEAAILDAMRAPEDPRRVDAVVTAPISKESWSLAGYRWPGHTELFAFRTRARRHCMAFSAPNLRVTLATTHVPLMNIRDLLTIGRVFDPIDLGNHFCKDMGVITPRIAVCGLNPHAGEHGLFGDEEDRIIRPAIEMAVSAGIDASGPWPADTIFREAILGRYDLVVAMYHDQGLIPVKMLAFDKAVNVTLGIPIIRTSPDHGTAFGIAREGKADAGAMREAMLLAARLALHRMESGTRGVSTGHHPQGPARGEWSPSGPWSG
ncbi:MAG: 4-hydroxythreonine-4-phosphate dehydrogenase PdxA [Phycisphaerales bacterium]|nr:4-hydroxythreonine-4-phosphate dehydrogenase PdxA [Phycisphaerales bacterium]